MEGACVLGGGGSPTSFVNVCVGFSVDIMLCHFKVQVLKYFTKYGHGKRSRWIWTPISPNMAV